MVTTKSQNQKKHEQKGVIEKKVVNSRPIINIIYFIPFL